MIAVFLLLIQVAFSAAQILSLVLARQLWLADLANFIRPHLLVAGVCLLVLGLIVASRGTRIGGVIAVGTAILPFAWLPVPAPTLEGQAFTLVSANVLNQNRNPAPFLALPDVVAADVLVLQEVTPLWQNALVESELWQHESGRDLRANSDMKVLSRFPILDERLVFADSTDTGGRHAVRLELSVEDRRVVLYAVHPQTPRRPAMWRERQAYLRDLVASIETEPADAAVIVAGDWNTPPWSPFFTDFLVSTGYLTTESRWWPLPTRFSTRFGNITQAGTPIDRVVLSPNVRLVDITIGPRFGSNHLPVIARLSVP